MSMRWTDILAISATADHILASKIDDPAQKCDSFNHALWNDTVPIFVGTFEEFGLALGGTVVSAIDGNANLISQSLRKRRSA